MESACSTLFIIIIVLVIKVSVIGEYLVGRSFNAVILHISFSNLTQHFHPVVILVPTRELALQTSQVCKELGKHLNIQVMVTTGGTSLKDDIMRLYQPVHLLVGTPGRILDLAKKGVCVLKDCNMLVMDEVYT